jgi:hypothetical protein
VLAVDDGPKSDTTGLDPLYNQMNPESSNTIFQPTPDGTRRSGSQGCFSLDGADIAVHNTVDAVDD